MSSTNCTGKHIPPPHPRPPFLDNNDEPVPFTSLQMRCERFSRSCTEAASFPSPPPPRLGAAWMVQASVRFSPSYAPDKLQVSRRGKALRKVRASITLVTFSSRWCASASSCGAAQR